MLGVVSGVGLDLKEVLFPAGKIEFLGHVF